MKQAVLVILIALLSVVSVFSQTGSSVLVKNRKTVKIVEKLGEAMFEYQDYFGEKVPNQIINGISKIDSVRISFKSAEKVNNFIYLAFYFEDNYQLSIGFWKKDGILLFLHESEAISILEKYGYKELNKLLSAIEIPKRPEPVEPDWSNKKF
ncbi:hypothetical protein HN954_00045 [bacterium]|jgi:hypothetical protein|nr:hypothetical protein [bacterium]MBT6832027.1 hypothetical protein [bacterium]MBT6995808.1 hypothetical protein [bacterium]MBT7772381.1 hypothetical protein [bacterium]